MPKPRRPLNAKQENAIRAEARGEDHMFILHEYMDLPEDADSAAINAADCRLRRLRQRPEYDGIWADELKKTVRRHVPGALQTIIKQAKNEPNDWLANKAANDCLTFAGRIGAVANEEEKEVVVRVEGMPELGTPDQDV